MSDLTRASALKRLVGMAVMPQAMPKTGPLPTEVALIVTSELRAVYQNMIWAMAPMLDSAQPGQMIRVEPFEETKRRLGCLAEALEAKP